MDTVELQENNETVQTAEQELNVERCIISVNWEKFHEIEKLFKLIFPHGRRQSMIDKANILRYHSSTWSHDEVTQIADPKINEQFNQVFELAKKVVRFVYLGKMMRSDDPEEIKSWEKMYHDMCMILYRYVKKIKKEQIPVPLSLLTPGTVVEYCVESVSKGPKIRTVKHLSGCDMNHGIVECEETSMRSGSSMSHKFEFPHSEHDRFNSSHITKIIKHVPGPLQIKVHEDWDPLKCFIKHDVEPKVGKSKKTYHVTAYAHFLIPMVVGNTDLLKDWNQSIDGDVARMALSKKCPGLKIKVVDEDSWGPALATVRKKKVKRFIRQNMNRFLMSMKEQRRREKEYYESMNNEPMDHDD